MKQQIFQRADADLCQTGRHLVPHPAQDVDRMLKNALAQARPDKKGLVIGSYLSDCLIGP